MPHDCNGKKLKKGDKVTMTFEVVDIFPGAEDCNVNLKAEMTDSAKEATVYQPSLTCSSKLTTVASLLLFIYLVLVPVRILAGEELSQGPPQVTRLNTEVLPQGPLPRNPSLSQEASWREAGWQKDMNGQWFRIVGNASTHIPAALTYQMPVMSYSGPVMNAGMKMGMFRFGGGGMWCGPGG